MEEKINNLIMQGEKLSSEYLSEYNKESLEKIAKTSPNVLWAEAMKMIDQIDDYKLGIDKRKENLIYFHDKYEMITDIFRSINDEYMTTNLESNLAAAKEHLERDFRNKLKQGDYLFDFEISIFNRDIHFIAGGNLRLPIKEDLVKGCNNIIARAEKAYDFDISADSFSYKREELISDKEEVINYMNLSLALANIEYDLKKVKLNASSYDTYKDYLKAYGKQVMGENNMVDFLLEVISGNMPDDLLDKDSFKKVKLLDEYSELEKKKAEIEEDEKNLSLEKLKIQSRLDEIEMELDENKAHKKPKHLKKGKHFA